MAATATAGPRYAPEDPTLPKPWRGLVDGKTGYLYFWNPETNVTQYERPIATALPSKSSLVPISSSVQVQQSSRRGYSPVKEEDRYGRGNGSGSKPDAGTNFNQNAKGGGFQSQNVPNGTANGPGGPSARGHGSSAGGSILSPEAYRRRHEISVTGDDVPPPLTTFEATGFPSEILREVLSAGFSVPTPIQAQSWPIALQSKDIVAIAKTGSGKTLGYLLPGFIHLKRCRNDPQLGPTVLVLSPTRELATQIQDEAVKFGRSSRISCTCLYGGAPKGPQLKELDRGVDIVVATPGRLNDILEMRRISLSQVSYLVLDEADRMLDMGFEPQIRKIVKEVPSRRQTLMYTATWPREVRKIAADLLVNPVQVNIGNVDELVANKSITQYIEVLAPMEKHRRLEQILRSQEPGSKIIIFCSTKKMCDQLARNLTRTFGAAAIHGDKSQSERDHVLSQFRTGRSPVLVATDVAARGLDIKDIRVVINYDFPTGVEDYVHRIGRTGRAGATGVAYTFFGDQDAKYASDLIKVLEGASQRVPPEIRDMASRGSGMSKFRRWGSAPGGRDGGRGGRSDFGYSGRDGGRGSFGMSSSYSSRPEKGGGRGYDYESRDRSDRGRSRSRSPDRGSGLGDRSKSWNRDRSRSPDRNNRAPPTRSPVRSFHQAMMEKGRASSPPQNQLERSRSPCNGGGSSFYRPSTRERSPVRSFHQAMVDKGPVSQPPRNKLDRSGSPYGGGGPGSGHVDRGYNDGPRSHFGEEEEEGMIPADEDGIIPPDDGGMYRGADKGTH
ncbi:DEAD-box ATP-dependent RNA helicase 46 [Ricinus communis]|uniref:RNA helicase n=1 Tax=Ricinus communis TaxID=3988 RepID=B9S627_RICCO|nr:DEAD-box ATP-dependent RNA helicase 46 [Ricinus communis]EEF40936.1 dead box ATP-dependent RNA helicase, putative [Ricinus communis]|eukprot:XP_002521446.1 DEAD-box ATP-dependent RNA helicase 46 [Ricinus communis]